MRRTQISLADEERRLLDAVAARTGRSMSSLIREAVSAHFGGERDPGDVRAALDASFGAWRDREEGGAQYVERLRTGTRWERLSQ